MQGLDYREPGVHHGASGRYIYLTFAFGSFYSTSKDSHGLVEINTIGQIRECEIYDVNR